MRVRPGLWLTGEPLRAFACEHPVNFYPLSQCELVDNFLTKASTSTALQNAAFGKESGRPLSLDVMYIQPGGSMRLLLMVIIPLSSWVHAAERITLHDGTIIEPVVYHADLEQAELITSVGKVWKRIPAASIERIDVVDGVPLTAAMERPFAAPTPATIAVQQAAGERQVFAQQAAQERTREQEIARLKNGLIKAAAMMEGYHQQDQQLAANWPALQQQCARIDNLMDQLRPQITAAQDRANQEVDRYGPRGTVRTAFNTGGVPVGGPLPATVTLLANLNAQQNDLIAQRNAVVQQMNDSNAQRTQLAAYMQSLDKRCALEAENLRALEAGR